ncbi:hypothetical protein AVT69_gp072 [Pseudomonas phage PhiPA3]|uniref:Uncharacterized protein 073 n=1 Tax=Pseudomonas phage PhiPA3 TaxID=998086 RepID=F8SJV2_BPPA3|nr:hypothetical protein AVT69_gp072 [Pseudomonas phage PhiPA3]AEH03497.1 hypothetical protein [Pseudomonas phage PhiPA3]
MHTFGLEPSTKVVQLTELINNLDAVRPTVAEMLTRKAYHHDYGIFDHSAPHATPLDLVKLHPKEDIWEGGPEFTWMRKYVNLNIGEISRLNIDEFFELPYPRALFLTKLAEYKSTIGDSKIKELEKEIQGMTKK